MYLLSVPNDNKKEERPAPQHKVERLKEVIEPWFFFSLVWSVGATGDAISCQRFSSWLKEKMAEEKVRPTDPKYQLELILSLDLSVNIVDVLVSD